MNIVAGFAGEVDIWDVVNEPINTLTWDNLYEGAGRQEPLAEPIPKVADWVEPVMRAAHIANPEALLLINEYFTIKKSETRRRFFELIKELQSRNTPIGGLGLQGHEPRQEWFSPQQLIETYDYLGELGLGLHITEFIPQSSGKKITGGWRKGKWTLEAQAECTEQFYRLSFGHPAVESILYWGLIEKTIWLKGGGLLDENYEPKPVYHRLKKLIHEEWKTRITASADDTGKIKFRGFYGNYIVKIKTADGKEHRFKLGLHKESEKDFTFNLKP